MVEVIPFNDFFYKSCYYNSLFSILQTYNLDISPLLLHDIFYYDCNINDKDFKIKLKYKELISAKEIMSALGFQISSKYHVENVINSIKEELDNNTFVIIWIDCYYLSNRMDTYQKHHWPHSILFYDYFCENNYFKIIDHDKKETLTYRRRSISAEDIQNAYHGFSKMFQNRDYDQFYAIKRIGNGVNHYEGMNRKKVYRENIESNFELLYHGVETLKELDGMFLEQVYEKRSDSLLLTKVIDDLNDILMKKIALLYLYNLVIEPENIWNLNCKIIQNKIRLLRDVLVKCYLTNRINKEEIAKRICFRELYKLEKECLEHLF